jgi:hypothetical protein
VEAADIEAVCHEFMQPTESVFAHFIDAIKGSGHQVTQQLARLAGQVARGKDGQEEWELCAVKWDVLIAALPNFPPDKLRRTLFSLTENDILWQPTPESWQFASLLFQQWLELNPV